MISCLLPGRRQIIIDPSGIPTFFQDRADNCLKGNPYFKQPVVLITWAQSQWREFGLKRMAAGRGHSLSGCRKQCPEILNDIEATFEANVHLYRTPQKNCLLSWLCAFEIYAPACLVFHLRVTHSDFPFEHSSSVCQNQFENKILNNVVFLTILKPEIQWPCRLKIVLGLPCSCLVGANRNWVLCRQGPGDSGRFVLLFTKRYKYGPARVPWESSELLAE